MSIPRRSLRLKEISDIINAIPVHSQAELLRILQTRGFEVTQASLSRDLKALNVKKTKPKADEDGFYVPMDVSDAEELTLAEDPRASAAGILSFALTGNLAVLKTRNGYAGGIAYDIDMLGSPLILGTIAGGDTVFVALAETALRRDVVELFSGILPPRLLDLL